MGKKNNSRYVIVPHRPGHRTQLWAALALAWLLSLAALWAVTNWNTTPILPGLSSALTSSRGHLHQVQEQLQASRQQQATLERSDQISRAANRKLQQSLAEREEEIADLQANLAFYERLAGATGKPKGLSVHSAEFSAERGGTWRYQIVLTQSLERGTVSAGKLRFSIDGVRDGKLTSIAWDELHQREDAPAHGYSFRYFQQIKGSVMLPVGFTPQRVRVSLRGENASFDQALAWVQPAQTGDI
ncbi:DUF6776 family protein [Lysobacter sp. A286]